MSLKIEKNVSDITKLELSGRLDTSTAPEFEAVLDEVLSDANGLELNFDKLEYISSAGLRLILKAYKAMAKKGGMKLTHVNASIKEVLEITGFMDFLNIE